MLFSQLIPAFFWVGLEAFPWTSCAGWDDHGSWDMVYCCRICGWCQLNVTKFRTNTNGHSLGVIALPVTMTNQDILGYFFFWHWGDPYLTINLHFLLASREGWESHQFLMILARMGSDSCYCHGISRTQVDGLGNGWVEHQQFQFTGI